MKRILLILAIPLLFSSCATLLNPQFQKVTIDAPSNSEVFINGKKNQTKNDKYRLKRDFRPQQITIKRKGYKDENIAVMQHHKSPLVLLSVWNMFGLALDHGKRAYNYDSHIKTGKNVAVIPKKEKDIKRLQMNKLGVNIASKDIEYTYFLRYKDYKNGESGNTRTMDEDLQVENTIFSLLLNDILKEKGYIDTSNNVLKSSYLNNALVNATISGYKVTYVSNYTNGGIIYNNMDAYEGLHTANLTIDWEMLDYYGGTTYSLQTNTISGEFAVNTKDLKKRRDNDKAKDRRDKAIYAAIKDAMECSLIEFMSDKKVQELLRDKSDTQTEKFISKIFIPKQETYVSNMSEAVKSSVTIKNEKGHGSGFIISSDGYIVTNYHVVQDTTNLKVMMNDESEHDLEVIRFSKIYDLAILKIKAENLLPFQISSSKDIELAAKIYAVGTPTSIDLAQTVSKGIISGIRDRGEDSKLIQTDASVNSGNSGGAIVTKEGLVLGVVSSKLKGFGIEGVAFGIPAYEILDRLNIKIRN